MSSDQVLAATATEAAYLSGTSTHDGIVHSTGSLRLSWLLHTSAIGFTYQAPIVTNECITGTRSWCYGTGWSTTANYAPNRTAALQAIQDVHAILDAVAP
jgi:hypothetical protein